LLGITAEEDDSEDRVPPSQGEDAFGSSSGNRQAAAEGQTAGERKPPNASENTEPPPMKEIRRRRLRRKVAMGEGQRWEVARQDAWLRELLTDNSGSESEDGYSRFAESGRWIAKMTGSRDEVCHEREEGEGVEAPHRQRRHREESVPDQEKPESQCGLNEAHS
jgi:hypothetical protein